MFVVWDNSLLQKKKKKIDKVGTPSISALGKQGQVISESSQPAKASYIYSDTFSDKTNKRLTIATLVVVQPTVPTA